MQIRLLVPRNSVGALIGKGGVVIKSTQEDTGARLQVSNEPLPSSTEKTLTIVGTPDQIQQVRHISRKLFSPQTWCLLHPKLFLSFSQVLERVLAQLAELPPPRLGTKFTPYIPGAPSFTLSLPGAFAQPLAPGQSPYVAANLLAFGHRGRACFAFNAF